MDITLHYEEKGQGTPLILLHGNGEDHTYFVHQMDYFSATRRVIALDTRGHGQSPRGTAPFSIEQFGEDLLDFMDTHQLAQADLLGFSDGGNIALTFALQHPERIRRLVLNGANLNPSGVKPSVQIPIVLGYHMATFFGKKSQKAHRNAELLGLMVKEPNLKPEELRRIPNPTLVIAGTKDMIREEHTKEIFRNLPHAELAILPGDHFLANQSPQAFNAAVAAFLDKGETQCFLNS